MVRYDLNQLAVLLIDDSALMRRLIDGMLRGYGVEMVHRAPDGHTGLDILNRHSIDLVITDWLMEPMDGFDFVRLVRTDSDVANPMVPILMMTGHSELWRVAAARDAGINEFIVKPVTPESLLARLLYMIDKPRPFVRTQSYFGPDRRRKADYPYFGPDRRREVPPAAAVVEATEVATAEDSLAAAGG